LNPLGIVFTAAGWLLGALIFYLYVPRFKLTRDQALILIGAAFVGGTLGAKLGQGFAQGAIVQGLMRPELGGRAIFAGVIGGWIGVEIAKRVLRIKHSTGDAWALALPAGEAVGRIGCFFNGCCYGRVCDLPWAVNQHDALRHPTQIYSALAAAAIFGAVWLLRERLRSGRLFLVYLALFGVARLVVEFYREPQNMVGPLSTMQWFSIELIVTSAATIAVVAWRGLFLREDAGADGTLIEQNEGAGVA
jgi:phosphatidylglycerol:prolipoprotein diacylglycerol transferase